MFDILDTDKVFYDSPNTGDPACCCSRCGKPIPEDVPAVRAWPSEPGDQGYDPNATGGTEFRYHPECVGIIVASDPFSSSIPAHGDGKPDYDLDNI